VITPSRRLLTKARVKGGREKNKRPIRIPRGIRAWSSQKEEGRQKENSSHQTSESRDRTYRGCGAREKAAPAGGKKESRRPHSQKKRKLQNGERGVRGNQGLRGGGSNQHAAGDAGGATPTGTGKENRQNNRPYRASPSLGPEESQSTA